MHRRDVGNANLAEGKHMLFRCWLPPCPATPPTLGLINKCQVKYGARLKIGHLLMRQVPATKSTAWLMASPINLQLQVGPALPSDYQSHLGKQGCNGKPDHKEGGHPAAKLFGEHFPVHPLLETLQQAHTHNAPSDAL